MIIQLLLFNFSYYTSNLKKTNSPSVSNPGQEDVDSDGIGDACDVCPNKPLNDDQDGDGVCGDVDNCPDVFNLGQEDADEDSTGDVCEIYNVDSSIFTTYQLTSNTFNDLAPLMALSEKVISVKG